MPTPKQNPIQAARRGATPSNARNKSAGAATANIAIAQAYVADVTTPEGRAAALAASGKAPTFAQLLHAKSFAELDMRTDSEALLAAAERGDEGEDRVRPARTIGIARVARKVAEAAQHQPERVHMIGVGGHAGDDVGVAGLVINHLRRLPALGDTFTLNGWRFEVIDLDDRRIDKLLVARE